MTLPPDQLRAMLLEVLSDPETRRLLLTRLAPVFPIAGGVCGTLAKDVGGASATERQFGASGCNTGGSDYSFPANVGIGTTSPLAPLHIFAAMPSQSGYYYGLIMQPTVAAAVTGDVRGIFVNEQLAAGTYTVANRKGIHIYDVGKGSSGVTVTNNYGLYIDSIANGATNYQLYSAGAAPSYFAGRVGIGTTDPQSLLDIAQGGTTGVPIRALASGLSNGQYLQIYLGRTAATNDTATISFVPDDTAANSTLRLGLYGSSDTLAIRGNGNVGIGTTSPTNILSLGGDSAHTVWMERHTTSNTAGNNLTLQAGGATSGATNKNGGNLVLSSGIATGSSSSQIQFQTATAGAAGTSDRSPSTKMVIDGGGSVILGATATKQSSGQGGPELISAQGSDQDKVVLWCGLPTDDNARFLFSYRGFLEWGPGTGTPNDQDVALFRDGAGGLSIENFYASGASPITSTRAFRVSMPELAGNPEGAELFAVDTTNKAMRVARGESGFSGSESFRVARAQTTTTSSAATLATITLNTPRAYYITVRIVARKSDGNDRAFFYRTALVYREGGDALIQGQTNVVTPIQSGGATG